MATKRISIKVYGDRAPDVLNTANTIYQRFSPSSTISDLKRSEHGGYHIFVVRYVEEAIN